MKGLKVITILGALSTFSFAGIVPLRTAKFYEACYTKYINKEVSFNVSCITTNLSQDKKLKAGVRAFNFQTYDGPHFGGSIKVYIPDSKVEKLVKYFGLIEERDEEKRRQVKCRLFKGVLKYDEDNGLYAVMPDISRKSPFVKESDANFTKEVEAMASSLSARKKAMAIKYMEKLLNASLPPVEKDEEE